MQASQKYKTIQLELLISRSQQIISVLIGLQTVGLHLKQHVLMLVASSRTHNASNSSVCYLYLTLAFPACYHKWIFVAVTKYYNIRNINHPVL